VIEERARTRPEGSYTTRLLGDENLRLKKLGEETTELVTALARADGERIAEEAADLLYHLLAALRGAGVELRAVLEALEARRR
jgi:phosphoribosyl-ATP pyrophosphohydrolase/phosphoribosyl-AMP cyclohydrolase